MVRQIDRQELARQCYDVLEVDRRGAYIFDYMVQRWARVAKKDGGLDALMDTIRCAAYREVLDDLVRLIDEGRNGPPPVPPGDDG